MQFTGHNCAVECKHTTATETIVTVKKWYYVGTDDFIPRVHRNDWNNTDRLHGRACSHGHTAPLVSTPTAIDWKIVRTDWKKKDYRRRIKSYRKLKLPLTLRKCDFKFGPTLKKRSLFLFYVILFLSSVSDDPHVLLSACMFLYDIKGLPVTVAVLHWALPVVPPAFLRGTQ